MYKKLCLKSKSDKNSESYKTNELKTSIYSGDWEESIVLFFNKSLCLPSAWKQNQTPSQTKSFCKGKEMGHFNERIANTWISYASAKKNVSHKWWMDEFGELLWLNKKASSHVG